MTREITITWVCEECGREYVRSDGDPAFGNPGTWATLVWGKTKRADFCGPTCLMRWLDSSKAEAVTA